MLEDELLKNKVYPPLQGLGRLQIYISNDVAIRGEAAEPSAAMRITAKCRATENLKEKVPEMAVC